MKRPERIHNEVLWIKQCTRIRARAADCLEGRLDIFEAARAITMLARLTFAEADPDLRTFERIDGEVGSLPIGDVRAYWAAHALAREDLKIAAIKDKWWSAAMKSALKIKDKYDWSLEARAALRRASGSA